MKIQLKVLKHVGERESLKIAFEFGVGKKIVRDQTGKFQRDSVLSLGSWSIKKKMGLVVKDMIDTRKTGTHYTHRSISKDKGQALY